MLAALSCSSKYHNIKYSLLTVQDIVQRRLGTSHAAPDATSAVNRLMSIVDGVGPMSRSPSSLEYRHRDLQHRCHTSDTSANKYLLHHEHRCNGCAEHVRLSTTSDRDDSCAELLRGASP